MTNAERAMNVAKAIVGATVEEMSLAIEIALDVVSEEAFAKGQESGASPHDGTWPAERWPAE